MNLTRPKRHELSAFWSLGWSLPTAVAILLVWTGFQTGFALPIPFFIIITCVVVGGACGGSRSGLASAAMAVGFLVVSYFQGFGPPTLTGGVFQTMLGSILFLFLGHHLGRLKDERDAGIAVLKDNEQRLRASLSGETREKEQRIALAAESSARLSTAVRIAGIGHFEFNSTTGECVFCSESHAAHFGLTAAEFQHRTTGPNSELFYIHPDDRAIVLGAIDDVKGGETQIFEYRGLTSSGEIRYIREIVEPTFDERGDILTENGTSVDVTELRLAELKLRQSQRIEALGTLTGGVAHDFNNLLAIIMGNLELSLHENRPDDWRKLIGTAIEATQRGADLTQNLLSFSRRAHLEPKQVDLNGLIENTLTWASRILPETIAVKSMLAADLHTVKIDAASAENAIINLLTNARDATSGHGQITIKTTNLTHGEANEELQAGDYVVLSISDTGHGIAADKINAVFEPFYTGKPLGEGRGLGLSMVQGFMKQSGGAVRLSSIVGEGTTFDLYFRAEAPQGGETSTGVPHRTVPAHLPANILLVEDEPDVLAVLKRFLSQAGYNVTTANSGDEALVVVQRACNFDLLLTDVVMPGILQGPDLTKSVRAICPDIRCIYLSGYAAGVASPNVDHSESDIQLMKPIGRDALLAAIAETLSAD